MYPVTLAQFENFTNVKALVLRKMKEEGPEIYDFNCKRWHKFSKIIYKKFYDSKNRNKVFRYGLVLKPMPQFFKVKFMEFATKAYEGDSDSQTKENPKKQEQDKPPRLEDKYKDDLPSTSSAFVHTSRFKSTPPESPKVKPKKNQKVTKAASKSSKSLEKEKLSRKITTFFKSLDSERQLQTSKSPEQNIQLRKRKSDSEKENVVLQPEAKRTKVSSEKKTNLKHEKEKPRKLASKSKSKQKNNKNQKLESHQKNSSDDLISDDSDVKSITKEVNLSKKVHFCNSPSKENTEGKPNNKIESKKQTRKRIIVGSSSENSGDDGNIREIKADCIKSSFEVKNENKIGSNRKYKPKPKSKKRLDSVDMKRNDCDINSNEIIIDLVSQEHTEPINVCKLPLPKRNRTELYKNTSTANSDKMLDEISNDEGKESDARLTKKDIDLWIEKGQQELERSGNDDTPVKCKYISKEFIDVGCKLQIMKTHPENVKKYIKFWLNLKIQIGKVGNSGAIMSESSKSDVATAFSLMTYDDFKQLINAENYISRLPASGKSAEEVEKNLKTIYAVFMEKEKPWPELHIELEKIQQFLHSQGIRNFQLKDIPPRILSFNEVLEKTNMKELVSLRDGQPPDSYKKLVNLCKKEYEKCCTEMVWTENLKLSDKIEESGFSQDMSIKLFTESMSMPPFEVTPSQSENIQQIENNDNMIGSDVAQNMLPIVPNSGLSNDSRKESLKSNHENIRTESNDVSLMNLILGEDLVTKKNILCSPCLDVKNTKKVEKVQVLSDKQIKKPYKCGPKSRKIRSESTDDIDFMMHQILGNEHQHLTKNTTEPMNPISSEELKLILEKSQPQCEAKKMGDCAGDKHDTIEHIVEKAVEISQSPTLNPDPLLQTISHRPSPEIDKLILLSPNHFFALKESNLKCSNISTNVITKEKSLQLSALDKLITTNVKPQKSLGKDNIIPPSPNLFQSSGESDSKCPNTAPAEIQTQESLYVCCDHSVNFYTEENNFTLLSMHETSEVEDPFGRMTVQEDTSDIAVGNITECNSNQDILVGKKSKSLLDVNTVAERILVVDVILENTNSELFQSTYPTSEEKLLFNSNVVENSETENIQKLSLHVNSSEKTPQHKRTEFSKINITCLEGIDGCTNTNIETTPDFNSFTENLVETVHNQEKETEVEKVQSTETRLNSNREDINSCKIVRNVSKRPENSVKENTTHLNSTLPTSSLTKNLKVSVKKDKKVQQTTSSNRNSVNFSKTDQIVKNSDGMQSNSKQTLDENLISSQTEIKQSATNHNALLLIEPIKNKKADERQVEQIQSTESRTNLNEAVINSTKTADNQIKAISNKKQTTAKQSVGQNEAPNISKNSDQQKSMDLNSSLPTEPTEKNIVTRSETVQLTSSSKTLPDCSKTADTRQQQVKLDDSQTTTKQTLDQNMVSKETEKSVKQNATDLNASFLTEPVKNLKIVVKREIFTQPFSQYDDDVQIIEVPQSEAVVIDDEETAPELLEALLYNHTPATTPMTTVNVNQISAVDCSENFPQAQEFPSSFDLTQSQPSLIIKKSINQPLSATSEKIKETHATKIIDIPSSSSEPSYKFRTPQKQKLNKSCFENPVSNKNLTVLGVSSSCSSKSMDQRQLSENISEMSYVSIPAQNIPSEIELTQSGSTKSRSQEQEKSLIITLPKESKKRTGKSSHSTVGENIQNNVLKKNTQESGVSLKVGVNDNYGETNKKSMDLGQSKRTEEVTKTKEYVGAVEIIISADSRNQGDLLCENIKEEQVETEDFLDDSSVLELLDEILEHDNVGAFIEIESTVVDNEDLEDIHAIAGDADISVNVLQETTCSGELQTKNKEVSLIVGASVEDETTGVDSENVEETHAVDSDASISARLQVSQEKTSSDELNMNNKEVPGALVDVKDIVVDSRDVEEATSEADNSDGSSDIELFEVSTDEEEINDHANLSKNKDLLNAVDPISSENSLNSFSDVQLLEENTEDETETSENVNDSLDCTETNRPDSVEVYENREPIQKDEQNFKIYKNSKNVEVILSEHNCEGETSKLTKTSNELADNDSNHTALLKENNEGNNSSKEGAFADLVSSIDVGNEEKDTEPYVDNTSAVEVSLNRSSDVEILEEAKDMNPLEPSINSSAKKSGNMDLVNKEGKEKEDEGSYKSFSKGVGNAQTSGSANIKLIENFTKKPSTGTPMTTSTQPELPNTKENNNITHTSSDSSVEFIDYTIYFLSDDDESKDKFSKTVDFAVAASSNKGNPAHSKDILDEINLEQNTSEAGCSKTKSLANNSSAVELVRSRVDKELEITNNLSNIIDSSQEIINKKADMICKNIQTDELQSLKNIDKPTFIMSEDSTEADVNAVRNYTDLESTEAEIEPPQADANNFTCSNDIIQKTMEMKFIYRGSKNIRRRRTISEQPESIKNSPLFVSFSQPVKDHHLENPQTSISKAQTFILPALLPISDFQTNQFNREPDFGNPNGQNLVKIPLMIDIRFLKSLPFTVATFEDKSKISATHAINLNIELKLDQEQPEPEEGQTETLQNIQMSPVIRRIQTDQHSIRKSVGELLKNNRVIEDNPIICRHSHSPRKAPINVGNEIKLSKKKTTLKKSSKLPDFVPPKTHAFSSLPLCSKKPPPNKPILKQSNLLPVEECDYNIEEASQPIAATTTASQILGTDCTYFENSEILRNLDDICAAQEKKQLPPQSPLPPAPSTSSKVINLVPITMSEGVTALKIWQVNLQWKTQNRMSIEVRFSFNKNSMIACDESAKLLFNFTTATWSDVQRLLREIDHFEYKRFDSKNIRKTTPLHKVLRHLFNSATKVVNVKLINDCYTPYTICEKIVPVHRKPFQCLTKGIPTNILNRMKLLKENLQNNISSMN